MRGGVAASVLHLVVAAGLLAQAHPPYKAGFPVTLTNGGTVKFGQPLVANLGLSSDGTKSIVFGTDDAGIQGKLHVLYKNASGSWVEPTGFPIVFPGPIDSSPAVGDLDSDGLPDIVIGFGTNRNLALPGGIRAYKNRGAGQAWTLLWQVTTGDKVPSEGNGVPDPVVATPAIGDVDGDGLPEVAFASFDQWLYLVHGSSGQPKTPGWPIFIRDTVWASPAIYDIDGDGRSDVIYAVDSHLEGAPFNTPNGGCIHVLRWDARQLHVDRNTGLPDSNPVNWPLPTEVAGWPKCVDQVIFSSPVVGDIDGDGRPEIVHGTGVYYAGGSEKIYAWRCDGTPAWGTPANPGITLTSGGSVQGAPALADLDGDGAEEVIVTSDNTGTGTTFRLRAYRGNGTAFFPAVQVQGFSGESLSASTPVVGDVLGDTEQEILVATNTAVAVFSASGVLLTEHTANFSNPTNFYTPGSLFGSAVVDFETDKAIEVVAVSAPSTSGNNTLVTVWNPKGGADPPLWGFFHYDEQRTGVAAGAGACQAGPCVVAVSASRFYPLTPCRVLDTRNANGPLGGPALSSGATRTFDFVTTPLTCGIPPTAKALALNVTVTAPTRPGVLSFAAGGCETFDTTSLAFSTNRTRANNAVLPLARDGSGNLTTKATLSDAGTVHLIVDVTGYFQ